MSIESDAQQLEKVFKVLGIDDKLRKVVTAFSSQTQGYLRALADIMEVDLGLDHKESTAVLIALLTTQTMALSIHREYVLSGKDPKEYLADEVQTKPL